jgi:thiamine thiazole synthase
MAPTAVSPTQQHAQLAFSAGKKAAVDERAGEGLTKPLADMMGNWENFSFAPIRESTVSRAMTRRCKSDIQPVSQPASSHPTRPFLTPFHPARMTWQY